MNMANSHYQLTDMAPIVNDTLVLVLAGGQGTRLKALTKDRTKPVLEFGGQNRIIDFTLSNCVNSGLNHIGVLTQYKSQCLIRHLMQHWGPLNSSFGGRLDVLPASQQTSQNWYQGTADAVYQNIRYIREMSPRFVIVLSGDHVYQMDYRALLYTHVQNQADMTVSCIEVPTQNAANQLGVLTVDNAGRIIRFNEKPTKPQELADFPSYCLASMGNYVFNTEFLLHLLTEDAKALHSAHDFGKNVIPNVINNFHVMSHRFRVPGGNQLPYWRDVGTLDSYWQAHMDLLNCQDRVNLANPVWPIWGQGPVSRPTGISQDHNISPCTLQQIILGGGTQLNGCSIKHSVLSERCLVEAGAELERCVLLPGAIVGKGSNLSGAIVDKSTNIPAGTVINNPQIAKEQGFCVTEKGIVLVTQDDMDRLTNAQAQENQANFVSEYQAG